MPINSYLAHPHSGKKQELANAINAIESCEVIPSKNKDLLIIVTETNSKEEDEQLKEHIESIPSLKLLAMVAGFNTPQNIS
ncbi:hypothetical protein AXE80_01425 [Wenyingzhuangia fucanilytica]|uniref:Uncharacterized protein n=1 Tax=Wenyingzhuangia fucanilytica TaxID=1790137 RepID=A0A1B1Y2N1_9FLAO|nr:hypothetical protein [Wenyingzhuangia fucanilytica]ANW95035.1 hypothetical protein AXE80_01425 [Wenyingzhuangia fucanilytica]